MRLLTWFLTSCLVSLLPASLLAQTIHGEVLEQDSRNPVSGALVLLVDAAGAERVGVFTGSNGRFVIEAPSPGRYTLRAERIGLGQARSAAFDLQAGQRIEQRLLAPVALIELSGVTVESTRRCQIRPADGDLVATTWEEARKVLNATRWTQGRKYYTYTLREHERDIDPSSLRVLRERTTEQSRVADRPFVSRSPAVLAREGYLSREGAYHTYYAPDAEVLLSDEFLDTHCFRAERPGRAQRGLVGLAFEPVDRREGIIDIRGVLWLEQETAELRYLEFRYTGLPLESGAQHVGGRVDFERLPSGHWFVRSYHIRMPLMASTLQVGSGPTTERVQLRGLLETGAQVIEVVPLEIRRQETARVAILGSISLEGSRSPLPGATVFLDGTAFSTTTDSAGRFRFDEIPAGSYQIRFYHPLMDGRNRMPSPRSVVADPGATIEVELAVPSR
jgi:hypothetical protein